MGNPIYAKKLEQNTKYQLGFDYLATNGNVYSHNVVFYIMSASSDVYLVPYTWYNDNYNAFGFAFLSDKTFKAKYAFSNKKLGTETSYTGSFEDTEVTLPTTVTTASNLNSSGAYCIYGATVNSELSKILKDNVGCFADLNNFVDSSVADNSLFGQAMKAIIDNGYKVGETDNWFCNGIEVAPFPETLLYKVLTDLNGISLIATDKSAEYVLHDSSGDTLVFNGAVACEAYIYDVENVAWVSEGNASLESLPCGNITWANYILNRKPSADSTETEEIPRDTMIGGTTYDGADYFETPDTGGSGGDNEGGNTDEPDNPIIDKGLDMNSFMLGYKAGKKLRRFRILGF